MNVKLRALPNSVLISDQADLSLVFGMFKRSFFVGVVMICDCVTRD